MEVNIPATVLSAVYPGLGQIKNLEITKGLFLILFFTMVLLMAFYPESQLQIVGFILLPVVWVWSVVDASQVFMYHPGTAVSPARMQKVLIGVVIAWLVIELIFVPTMWSITRHNNSDLDGSLETELAPNAFPSALDSEQDAFSVQGTSGGTTPAPQQKPEQAQLPAETSRLEQESTAPPGQTAEPSADQTTELPQAVEPSETQEIPETTKPPARESTQTLGAFAISIGAFKGPIQAGRHRDAARQAGFSAQVIRIRSSTGKLLYNVIVPGFDTDQDARSTWNKLRAIKRFQDSRIIRIDKLNIVE